MRNFVALLLLLTLTACSPTAGVSPTPTTSPTAQALTPAPTASPAPAAEITVSVFQDLNRDGQRDPGEPGLTGQIGLAPDTNCTIGDPGLILEATTDPSSGEYTYTALTPGEYCVLYRGAQPLTTVPAYTLTLSPGERSQVAFGLQP